LCDMGAEVIRVENHKKRDGGDAVRYASSFMD